MENEFGRGTWGADCGNGSGSACEDDINGGSGGEEFVGRNSVDVRTGVSVVEVNANNDGVEIVEDGIKAGWLRVKMGRQVWKNIRNIFPNLPEEPSEIILVAKIHAQNSYEFVGQLNVRGERYPMEVSVCFPYINCDYDKKCQLYSVNLGSPQCSFTVNLGALTANTAKQVHDSLVKPQLRGLKEKNPGFFGLPNPPESPKPVEIPPAPNYEI